MNLVYPLILGFSFSACSITEFSRSTVTAFYWPDALPVTSSKNNAVRTLNEIQINQWPGLSSFLHLSLDSQGKRHLFLYATSLTPTTLKMPVPLSKKSVNLDNIHKPTCVVKQFHKTVCTIKLEIVCDYPNTPTPSISVQAGWKTQAACLICNYCLRKWFTSATASEAPIDTQTAATPTKGRVMTSSMLI